MKKIIFLIAMATIALSCQYRKTNRRHHFNQKSYNKNQIINLKDAFICANIWGFFGDKRLEVNNDSIFNVFVKAFKKLPLDFDVKSGTVLCDRSLVPRYRIRLRNLNIRLLDNQFSEHNETVLIPIINYNYIPTRNMYFTSTGAVGGGGFSKNVHIELAILVFQKKELIYITSRLFSTESIDVNKSDQDIDFSIKQEHIDTLVQLTMKDYIKRMK